MLTLNILEKDNILEQCCGSGFNGSLDPYLDSQSGSRSKRVKMAQKIENSE
jgi:hypothetical protein